MSGNLGVSSILPQSHNTYPNLMRPIQYEKEILLHLCLRAEEMQCSTFTVSYQFKTFGFFDDVAVEFDYNGTFYSFLIQVKHSVRDTPLRDQDFTVEKRGNHLYLEKYVKSIPENGILTNRTCKFIILLNRKVEFTNIETVPEEDTGFESLFLRLFSNGGESKRLQEGVNVRNKSGQNILIDNEYFLNNFVICCNLPTLEDIRLINNQLICDMYQSDVEFAEKVRGKVFEALQVDSAELERPTLTKEFFREFIANSERHHDFYS